MSLSPDALDAYLRDYLGDRQREAAHAALVARARHARPPSRTVLSAAWLALLGQLSLLGPLGLAARLLIVGRPALALLRLPRK